MLPGTPFCANPACVLHVRTGDPGVTGSGNWARLANGLWYGRAAIGVALYCDACVRLIVLGLLVATDPQLQQSSRNDETN